MKNARLLNMSSKESSNGKWTTLSALQSHYPRWNPVCIGQSIWIPVDYESGEKGMAEFCCSTNTMKKPVPYPKGFKPEYASVCCSNDDDIVVVDGRSGKLMRFNTNTKKYGDEVSMPKLGQSTS